MDAIGGYFGLELKSGSHFHSESDSILLNSGRNCLEYILKSNQYKKLYLPYFTCDVLLEPLVRLQIPYIFYNINKNLEPIFNFDNLEHDAVFLYTNYFGIKGEFVKQLAKKVGNLIIDNAQGFFSAPISGIDTFYSPRKFLGVSDGAYLFAKNKLHDKFEMDCSADRMAHLLIRIDKNAEEGYINFSKNDKSLEGQPIKIMSNLTKQILKSIDYNKIIDTRTTNFKYIHNKLQDINKLKFTFDANDVPMVYPFWTGDKNLRARLQQNQIYCATYWPNVKLWNSSILERELTDNIIPLPIDQRYSQADMQKIISYV